MTTACKLLTVAAMLLHSIFGCSLHHAGACELHQHFAEADDVSLCHHDHACHDEHQLVDDEIGTHASVSDCCRKTPCEKGDSPCCSAVQCSFIPASNVEFSLHVGPALFVLVDIDTTFMESLRARRLADVGRYSSGIDDSPSRCALHCSWQI